MRGAMQSKAKLRNAVEFIAGPWPVRPVTFAVIAAVLNQFSGVRTSVSHGATTATAWIEHVPESLAIGLILGAGFLLAVKVIDRATTVQGKQLAFHGSMLTIAIMFSVIYGAVFNRTLSDAPINSLRVYLVILSASIAIGVSERRIRQQALRAEDALAEVDRQRSLLLQADESTRREVANFLHDKVQAGLVVANLELNKIAEKLEAQPKSELKSVVEELEEIRRFDVRDASRLLSPDIAVIGLNQCLNELTGRYRNTMTVSLNLPAELNTIGIEHQLALYRIVEQALLNAAFHGKAHSCEVSVSLQGNRVLLSVLNDGVSLNEAGRKAGSGTAVIDAWVSKLHGDWSLSMDHNNLVNLSAKFPLS